MDKDGLVALICLLLVIGVAVYRRQQRKKAYEERTSLVQVAFQHIESLATRNIQIEFVAGEPPDIVMRDGEHVLCVLPNTTLQAPRTVRRTRSVYGGPSIRIAKGIWWRFGESHSIGQSYTELHAIDVGYFMVTNQRVLFVGSQRTNSFPLDKVISIEAYTDGLVVHREGKEMSSSYLFDTEMKMSYQYGEQVLTTPVDGRLIRAAIDVARRAQASTGSPGRRRRNLQPRENARSSDVRR